MTSKNPFAKKWFLILVILLLCGVGIQFIRPGLDSPAVTADLAAPPEVKQIIERACYDCHSNKTNLAWFDQLAPAYWLVRAHILEGRQVLNFSAWDSLLKDQQKGLLFESLNQILFKEMPLKQYLLLHPGSRITDKDIVVLKNYLDTLAPVKVMPDNAATIRDNAAPVANTIQPALNGISYNGEYKNWEAISSTERFDNGSLRVILGNEIAIKAIKEHHLNPWPDGTQFAKVAWAGAIDPEGNVHTGEFKQVEFMIKDSHKYASTEGWGFARWKGKQLQPYGKTVLFTTECTNCHRPMRDNDFVFTQPQEASLPDTLSFNSLEWGVISSSFNKSNRTMSILYGNDPAVKNARAGAAYPAGSVVTLVTWQQKEDEHWFGARIPGSIQSIEQIKFSSSGKDSVQAFYEKYEGHPLRKGMEDNSEKTKSRIAYIAGQKASVMP